MKKLFLALSILAAAGATGSLSAASVCPTTSHTTSDCNFLITISSSGTASVSEVAGSSAFNGPITFNDGTSDPGDDGSLVGVINKSSVSLESFTLIGSGSGAGIFDFSFNGICVYTQASYCTLAQTGYEGPTTTFTDLRSTVLFQTTEGNVDFGPNLAPGASTFFAIEDAPSDINSNGGLSVSNVTLTPEPADLGLVAAGLGLVLFGRRRLTAK